MTAGRGTRLHRGALLGFGGVARASHLPGARFDPVVAGRVEIVAAVDPAPDASVDADIPVVATRDELGRFDLDFVDVCTPTAMHLESTIWALGKGYHVLCEKPVAVSMAEADTIARAARAAARVVVPCHQHRFNPAWLAMNRWLADGAIGHWHLAELSVYRLSADVGRDRSGRPWRTQASDGGRTAGGGIVLDHGTHLLYALIDAAGSMPVASRAWTGRLRHRGYSAEDTAQIILEFPDRLATITLTWAANHRENRVRFIGERGTIDWQGGLLRIDREGREPEISDFSAQLDKRSYVQWFARQYELLADTIDSGRANEQMEEISRVARVLESIYTAADTGNRAPV